jgi:long-chain fatty acid transport protein
LSVGGGVSVEYANLYQTVGIPIAPTVDGQGTVKLDNTAPGFNLGVMLEPYRFTNLGIAYRSQIVHDLRGSVSFMNTPLTPGATTKLVMPSNVIASLSQKITNHFTMLGELGWSNWSSMQNTVVTVDGFSAVTPQNWHDTYRVGLSGRYLYKHAATILAGASYDSSPTSSSKRLPELPMDRQIRLGVGVIYQLAQAVNLGVSYEYINLGSAGINNTSAAGVMSGSYSRNYANILQASLNVDC